MHTQYSSAKTFSSGAWITLAGSGQGAWGSGVTLEPDLTGLVGVQTPGVGFRGELFCCASFDLKKRHYEETDAATEKRNGGRFFKMGAYLSFLSSSLSSWRQRGLAALVPAPMNSGMEEGLHGLLRGVEVKQLLGSELGRSALTGVGLIRRDGLVALGEKRPEYIS